MRVTKKLTTDIYKTGLTAKKKHKKPSLTENEFCEYVNMVNVLNTVGRDQSEICGYLIERYLIPSKLTELITPIEVSYSGDRHGNNVLSNAYKTYNPASAGFIDASTLVQVLDGAEFHEVVKAGIPKFQSFDINEKEEFRVWLTPDEFNTLGSLILSTFKASTAENNFTGVDTLKDFGSFTTYGERLTKSSTLVRRTTTDYCPLDANFNLYVDSQYTYDKDEMFKDWFKSVCDNITSGN